VPAAHPPGHEDITRAKGAEVGLRTLTGRLERSNVGAGQFAYVVSHDLRSRCG